MSEAYNNPYGDQSQESPQGASSQQQPTQPYQQPSQQGFRPSQVGAARQASYQQQGYQQGYQQQGYQPAAQPQPQPRPQQGAYQQQAVQQDAYQQHAAQPQASQQQGAYQQQASYRPQATYQETSAQNPYQPAQQAQPEPQQRTYRPAQTASQVGGTIPHAQQQPQSQPSRQKRERTGMLKTFFAGFGGAAVAALLVLALTGNLLPSSNTVTTTTTTLGGGEQTTFSVEGESLTLPEAVAAKTLPSVVCIYVYAQQENPYGWFSTGGSTTETLASLGSGVILSEDGYIITNYHVIEGESSLKVSINNEQYDATLVGGDATSDLAVIKVEGATDLVPIEVGSSADLVVGEWVMTVGSPYGMEQSVGSGIVSAVSRSSASLQTAGDSAIYANLIQTDAPINPGNSGGALVDSDGKLVGINTLTASYSGSNSGVGFAIPIDYAYSIATQIINGEEPSHAQLGVSLLTIDATTAQRYGLATDQGAYVSSAYAGAAEAGIQEGDIITKIDGKTTTSATDVILAVRSHMPGDTVNVEVNRSGELLSMDAVLTSDTAQ